MEELSESSILPRLRTRWLARDYRYRRVTGSTNADACAAAEQGAAHGTICVADAQTAGRGRLRRSWYSPPGDNIYLSVVLRPTMATGRAPLHSLAAGVALADALGSMAPGVMLKWPNDVLYGARKVAGILLQMKASMQSIEHVVLGVGINVNSRDFPEELPAATSLALQTGRRVDRRAVLLGVLSALERRIEALILGDSRSIVGDWLAYAPWLGQRIRVQLLDQAIVGVAEGLGADGSLILQQDGRSRQITAGDISLIAKGAG